MDSLAPDTKASLTFDQTAQLVAGIRGLEDALANPIDKDSQAATLAETRKLFTKSLFAARDLSANCTLTAEDIVIRKPLIGVPASNYDTTIGRVTKGAIEKDHPIQPDNLN